MDQKEELLLETLSFFEAMTFEKIILDLSKEKLGKVGEFRRDELEALLSKLVKEKKVELIELNKEKAWKRLFKKKSLLSRLKNLFLR
ncbi:hypothetical protein HBN50_12305 [Halobacteriovorax sp. GB3]|uniref:hypothetical protein n=1 Tax=Halobacteriovorax sp. GB3 TaxID=2719615 RepID=UPI002362A4A1|nr:hypothetical protein [Halobacteriovorax sp. GB3]MDD0853885.1 hypothetical protein [Halobacteriovorax sp. GB3]